MEWIEVLFENGIFQTLVGGGLSLAGTALVLTKTKKHDHAQWLRDHRYEAYVRTGTAIRNVELIRKDKGLGERAQADPKSLSSFERRRLKALPERAEKAEAELISAVTESAVLFPPPVVEAVEALSTAVAEEEGGEKVEKAYESVAREMRIVLGIEE